MRLFAQHLLTVLACSILGLLVVFTSTPTAAAAEPIRIGIFAPHSQNEGRGIFNGAALAARNINAAGGIDGRMVKLYDFETHTSPVDAAQAFQKAVEVDHVVAMVGIFAAGVEAGVDPWAARLKVPLFIIGDDSMEVPHLVREKYAQYKYLFRNNTNPVQQAQQICKAAKSLLLDNPSLHGYNKVAIVAEDGAWTKDLVAGYQKCLPKAGFDVLNTTKFSLSTHSFAPVFERATAAGENVFVTAWGITGVVPTTQWHQDRVPALLIGIDAQGISSNFWVETHGATNGMITLGGAGFGSLPVTPKTDTFYNEYFKQYHILKPQFTAYTTYDTIYILKHAIEGDGGKTAGGTLVKAIEDVNFTGVSGQIHYYGRDGKYPHQLVSSTNPEKGLVYFLIQWQHGKQYIIWPKNLAQETIIIPPSVIAGNRQAAQK